MSIDVGTTGTALHPWERRSYLVPIFGVNIPENFKEETSVLEYKPAEGRERNPGMRPASANT